MAQKAPSLGKRYNKDGSVSILNFRGQVIFKHQDPDAIASFLKGYGPAKMRQAIFAKGA